MAEFIKKIQQIPLSFLILASLFFLLGITVVKLGLYIDDHVLIFPSLLKSYWAHFTGYTYDYGLMRPLALFFYYFIYDFSLIWSSGAHLFTFSLHFLTAILLWKILKKGLPNVEAILISSIFLVHPFFTEQYGWFSAAIASLANLILFLQILITLKPLSLIKKVPFLILLQTLGVLLYESIFFAFIPIAYLLIRNTSSNIKLYQKILLAFLIAIPSLIYNFLRNFVITPHLPSTIRELKLIEIFTGDTIEKVIINVQKLFESLMVLFNPYVLQTFWFNGFNQGWGLIINNFFTVILILIVSGSLVFLYILSKYEQTDGLTKEAIPPATFWFLLSFFTILPSFFLKAPSFPFRVLALPSFFLLIWIFIILRNRVKYFLIVYILIFIFSLGLTTNILNLMKLQQEDDERMIQDLMSTIEQRVSQDEKVELYVINSVHSTRTDIVYGEYLGSCVFNEWCLQAALNRRTGKVEKITIPPQPKIIHSDEKTLVFRYKNNPATLEFLE